MRQSLGSEQQVLIVANPKSGAVASGPKVEVLEQRIRERGYQVELFHDLESVTVEAERLFRSNRLGRLIAAGGDGTADALANLLPHDIPLQLFPMGTENLLAKHFCIESDIDQALQLLECGKTLHMDVGMANDKVFLVMASIGFDAQVVNEMHAIRTGHINRWSYTKPIWRALSKYRFPQLRFQIKRNDSAEFERIGDAAWGFIFNVPRYAANLEFCPQADPLDGALDLCNFRKSGLVYGCGYFWRLFRRSHQRMKGFLHTRCTEVLIESTQDEEVAFQIDGDPGGVLPLHIRVLPKRLSIVVPPNFQEA